MNNKNNFSLTRLDAHHKLYASLVLATICFFVIKDSMSASTQFMVCWLTYSVSSLILSALTIFNVHPEVMHQDAHAQDSSKTLVFLFALFAAIASLFAIVILMQNSRTNGAGQLTLHVLLSLACVISSWLLVHTIFTFRYAHFFYCNVEKEDVKDEIEPGGLEFPKENEPDYVDFLYFSYVIGMTFQVSDVQISSKAIRRLALLHGLLAFAFNTVIVALSINIIAGLIQK